MSMKLTLATGELVGIDGNPLPKPEPKAPPVQSLDLSAICQQMGEILIQNGIIGDFAVSIQVKDVPFLYDGQPKYAVAREWSANGQTEPDIELQAD